ncbi:MAG: acyltransferase family protein [Deltaproteobacteria bacterium]|nr:acyltransferase family protein [Deltaproteobacteria bacterium]
MNPKKITKKSISSFYQLLAPVFDLLDGYFSYEVKGLQNISKNKAALLVMNHGIIPYHGFLLARRLYRDAHIAQRSLGADFIFEIPCLRELFMAGGALPASPENARRLLKEGHLVTLAPGGIYESLVTQPGMKRIPWERHFGFAKLACELGVPVIPSYARGIDRVYWNSNFLLRMRIKILEKTRFSIPLFFGLGLLPLPTPITHRIGKALFPPSGKVTRKKVTQFHTRVLRAMQKLRDQ